MASWTKARAGSKLVMDKRTIWADEVNGAIDEVWGHEGSNLLERVEKVLLVGGGRT